MYRTACPSRLFATSGLHSYITENIRVNNYAVCIRHDIASSF